MSVAQNNVKPGLRHAASGIGRLAALVAAGVVAAACAGRQHVNNQDQAPPHPIEVQVDNSRLSPDEQPLRQPGAIGQASGPLEIRVFVTEDQGGMRQYLGTVAGGKTQTLKFTPTAYGNWYRLVGVTPLGTSVESTRFNINTPEIGGVGWSLQTGMIDYYDVATDTTKAGTAGSQPATSPTSQPGAQPTGNPPSTPPSSSPGGTPNSSPNNPGS
jgi:hypothetical protein